MVLKRFRLLDDLLVFQVRGSCPFGSIRRHTDRPFQSNYSPSAAISAFSTIFSKISFSISVGRLYQLGSTKQLTRQRLAKCTTANRIPLLIGVFQWRVRCTRLNRSIPLWSSVTDCVTNSSVVEVM